MAKAAGKSKAGGPQLTVRQVKSGIGFDKKQKATLRALGLGRLNRTRSLPDNPAVRGMLSRVSHLVEVVPAGEEKAS